MNKYKDKEIWRNLKRDPLNYEFLTREQKIDHDVLMLCLRSTSKIAQYLPDDIKNDIPLFTKYLPVNPFIFQYMSETLKKDDKLIALMLKNYQRFCDSIYNQENLDKDDFENNMFSYFPHMSQNKKINVQILESMDTNWHKKSESMMLKKLSDNLNDKLSHDIPYLSLLISKNYKIYEYLKPIIKDEPDLMVHTMKVSKGEAFPLFNEEFKSDPFFITHMLGYGVIEKSWLSKELRQQIGSYELKDYFKTVLLKENIENAVNEQVGDKIENPRKKLKI